MPQQKGYKLPTAAGHASARNHRLPTRASPLQRSARDISKVLGKQHASLQQCLLLATLYQGGPGQAGQGWGGAIPRY